MAKQAPAKQEMSVTSMIVFLLIAVTMAAAAAGGAFEGLGGKHSTKDRITYRYDCNFNDFYGGVEMQSWEGTGRKHPTASTDPFGALSRSAGEQPKGIGLHLIARALTPNVPLPQGAKPHLECNIVRVNETTGKEKVIKGPAKLNTRRAFIQIEVRAS